MFGHTTLLSLLVLLLVGYVQPPTSTARTEQRCGTLTGTERNRVEKLGAGIMADRPRPLLPLYADAPSGLFRVHYTRTGADAVPLEDLDGNGTPDYIDEALVALERSWTIQQAYQAPPQPPSDGSAGGSSALDIYVRDLSTAGSSGSGYYGITVPDSVIGTGPGGRWPRFTTWIEVDNDFSAADTNVYGDTVFATTGVAGLRITCAHELHHVAQLARMGNANVQLMLYEQLSTYMELVCYPEYDDWRVYASKFFRDPAAYALGDASAFAGYVWGWFPQAYGAKDVDVYSGIFDAMERGERPFAAVAQSTLASGVRLDSTFVSVLPDLYKTGNRAHEAGESTVLPEPDLLPEIAWYRTSTATPPAVLSSGDLRPFEVRAFRFTLPARSGTEPVTTSVLLTWPNMTAYQETDITQRKGYELVLRENPGASFQAIAGTSWGIRCEPADVVMWVNNAATMRPDQPYPLPIALSSSTTLFVPVELAIPGDPVVVTLMSPTLIGIREYREFVQLDDDRIVAVIEVPTSLAPGVYLLKTEYKGSTQLQKIAVGR